MGIDRTTRSSTGPDEILPYVDPKVTKALIASADPTMETIQRIAKALRELVEQ
ncbi:hypothetical protein AB0B25_21715 [Nocardia sp. NPDC049190]|uniref:hypothetical protein n=1 Tax=Nocardia sp. NPDC049190 TaxID=3155650 RepID=UPI0033C8DF6A